jgi:hypothetical protein
VSAAISSLPDTNLGLAIASPAAKTIASSTKPVAVWP